DPATQRSVAPIDQITVVPLRDTLTSALRIGASAGTPLELGSPDLDRSATLFDYLAHARGTRMIVSERDEIDADAARVFDQLEHSYHEAVHRQHIPAPPDCFADGRGVGPRLAQATSLSELAIENLGESAHIRCQPTIELNGRVTDWVAGIRALREQGDTVLFVAATAGRAERTIELLK